jgi:hypothetical protein
MGMLRMKVDDEINYKVNKREEYITANHYNGRCDTALFIKTRTDLGHDSLHLPQGILRICDAYGFSNVVSNPNPEVLFIGDSFFDDPHINTTEGIQALFNDKMKRNCAYNIGANGCSGFKVYNELLAKGYFSKPKVIFFETVERAMSTHIIEAAQQLKDNQFKTNKHHYLGLDLLLGANFKDIRDSKLFYQKKDKKYGAVKIMDGQKVWFLRNKLSVFAEVNTIIKSMVQIDSMLKKQGIDIIFIIAPDKESLYPQFFGPSKLIGLQEMMQQNMLNYLDVYTPMLQNPNHFYFASDTHWNGNAIELVASLSCKAYENLNQQ